MKLKGLLLHPLIWGFIWLWLLPITACTQHKLQDQFEQIAGQIDGKVGVNVLLLETGESVSFKGNKKFPMQSVYKFPIAAVMLRQIDKTNFSLKDTIHIDASEYIPQEGHSPIRETFPGAVNLTLKNILRYNIEESDGTACDVLLRLLGGPDRVEAHIHNMGITNIAIATTEGVQVATDTVQYQNWATPIAMSRFLSTVKKSNYLSNGSKALLFDYMSISGPWFDTRIKGKLPPATKVVHKTGSSGTKNGLTRATNDAGIIILPDGRHLAISVFVSDSRASKTDRDKTIAEISRAAYDYWTTTK